MKYVRIIFLCLLFVGCNFGEEKININSIKFNEDVISLNAGESRAVEINYLPLEADVTDEEIIYEVLPEDVIEISNTSKSGCIIEGKKRGSCVITVTAQNRISYLQVNVENTIFSADPYIVLPYINCEIEKGNKKTIVANLIGGCAADNGNFVWSSSNSAVVEINQSNNSAVLTAKKYGLSIITVTNPKAIYESQMIVYVPNPAKELFYLTTKTNTVTLLPNETKAFEVENIGGSSTDLSEVKFSIKNGEEYFDISSSNGSCTVSAKKCGMGTIEVFHPKSDVTLEIQVIINEKVDGTIIEVDNDFLQFNGTETKNINAYLSGTENTGRFSYEVENVGIVNVVQVNGIFQITSLKAGNTKIYIKNDVCDFVREVQIVVEETGFINNINYIYTSQNIIKTEAGSDLIPLYMTLGGGNETDKNGFKWSVSDSNIINLETDYGAIEYERAAKTLPETETLEAVAYIKPINTGIATIKVTHPKTMSECIVTVYVYPKYTFSALPLVVKGENLIKVLKGEKTDYKLNILQGKLEEPFKIDCEKDGIINYKIGENNNIEINGISSGMTALHISNKDMEYIHNVTVYCGTQDELDKINYLKTSESYIEMLENDIVYIYCDSNNNQTGYKVYATNDSIRYHVMDNVIAVEGIKKGEGDLCIEQKNCLNKVIIPYYIKEKNITIEKPFKINAEDFLGVVIGKKETLEIKLLNANEKEYENIEWIIPDNDIISINKNGNVAIIEGLKEGKVEITVKHEKSINDKKIIIYTAETKEKLNNKTIIQCDKNNYSGIKGNKEYIKIKVNNPEINNSKIAYKVDNIDILKIDSEENSLFIEYLNEGTATVEVKCNDVVLKLYFSVLNSVYNEKDLKFNLPAVIELEYGKNIKIDAECSDYVKTFSNYINWYCNDENLSYVGNGTNCLIQGIKAGNYVLKVEIEELGIYKDIQIIVYPEDMKEGYVIGTEYSYYKIKKDSVLNIGLLSGKKSLPEEIKSQIKWESSINNVLQIDANGSKASIKGLNEGICSIKIYSENKEVINNVEIKIEVYSEDINIYDCNFECDRIINAVIKNHITIPFALYREGKKQNYNNVSLNYDDGCNCSIENEKILFYCEKAGKYYLTLKHPYCSDYKILVCVYETEKEIENSFNYYTLQDNYLLEKGESKTVQVITSNNEENYLNNLVWSVEDNNIAAIEKIDNKNYKVTGLKKGNTVININYKNQTYKVNIFVSGNINNEDTNIITENIIAIKKGDEYQTSVYCKKTVKYICESNNILLEQNGNYCKITGKEAGLYELKAEISEYNYKTIIVYVYDEDINSNIFNIDQRFISISKGEEIRIKPYFYQNKTKLKYENKSEKKLCDISINEDEIEIIGKETGLQEIDIYSEEFNRVKLFINIVDSNKEYNDSNIKINNDYIIKADVNKVYIKEGETNSLRVNVEGINFNYYDDFKWTLSDYSVLKLEYVDNNAYITALKNGRCFVYCSNIYCSNIISFEVIVGDIYSEVSKRSKYIKVDSNVIRINYEDKEYEFTAELNNIENTELKNIKCSFTNNEIVSLSKTDASDKCLIKLSVLKCGKTRLTLQNENCDFETNIDIIVSYKSNGSYPYITTSQNYTLLKPGETKSLKVELLNYEEIDSSSFKWTILSGSDCITLIGNGPIIQVYANKEGFVKLNVEHIPTGSKLDLYLTVSNTVSEIKYITTAENVIETYISENMNSLEVQLIGDDTVNSKFKYSVDNSNVLSIMGNNNTLYYRGLNEGTAQVTVTNESDLEIKPLKINIIVLKQDENSSYIIADKPVIYLEPDIGSENVQIQFNNMVDYDESKLEWFIFSQQLSNNELGDVISIVSSGKKCVIKPLAKGLAKIKCNYSPLNLSTTINVFVSNYGKISFKEEKVNVCENDCVFASLNIPDFTSDLSEYITYKADDPNICKVFGTGKVCCIQGLRKGSCIITAVNSLDKTETQLGVNVNTKEEEKYTLSVNKSTYILNPRSEDQKMNAYLIGKDVTAVDDDKIKWEVISDTSGCINVYPNVGSEVLLKLEPCKDKNDKQYGSVKTGEAVIKVTHEYCGQTYYKSIFVKIGENENFFTLDKYSAKVTVGSTIDVTANIINGNISDYDNIIWSVSGINYDNTGTKVEVGRTMTKNGKKCTLYGLNDGVCTLTAYYFGSIMQCEINVESDKIFKINGALKYTMFPDQVPDNYLEIPYILKPSKSVPQWTVINTTLPTDEKVLKVEQVAGENKIRLIPMGKEETCKVTGIVVGVGSVTFDVDVKYNPIIKISEEDKLDFNKINIKLDKSNKLKLKYSYFPSIYKTKVTINGYDNKNNSRINYNVISSEIMEDGTVNETVEITINEELYYVQNMGSADIKISLLNTKDIEVMSDNFIIQTAAYENSNNFKLQTGYIRGKGCFTNFGSNQNKAYNLDENFETKGTKIIGSFNEDSIYLNDNEQHYIILHKPDDAIYDNLKVEISKNDNNLSNNYPINITQLANANGNETYSFLIDTTNNGSEKKLGYDRDKNNNNKTPRQSENGDGYYSRYYFYEPTFKIDNTELGTVKDLTWSTYNGTYFKGDYFEKNGNKYYYTLDFTSNNDTNLKTTEDLKIIKDIQSSCILKSKPLVTTGTYYFPYFRGVKCAYETTISVPGGTAKALITDEYYLEEIKELNVKVDYQYYLLRNGKIVLSYLINIQDTEEQRIKDKIKEGTILSFGDVIVLDKKDLINNEYVIGDYHSFTINKKDQYYEIPPSGSAYVETLHKRVRSDSFKPEESIISKKYFINKDNSEDFKDKIYLSVFNALENTVNGMAKNGCKNVYWSNNLKIDKNHFTQEEFKECYNVYNSFTDDKYVDYYTQRGLNVTDYRNQGEGGYELKPIYPYNATVNYTSGILWWKEDREGDYLEHEQLQNFLKEMKPGFSEIHFRIDNTVIEELKAIEELKLSKNYPSSFVNESIKCVNINYTNIKENINYTVKPSLNDSYKKEELNLIDNNTYTIEGIQYNNFTQKTCYIVPGKTLKNFNVSIESSIPKITEDYFPYSYKINDKRASYTTNNTIRYIGTNSFNELFNGYFLPDNNIEFIPLKDTNGGDVVEDLIISYKNYRGEQKQYIIKVYKGYVDNYEWYYDIKEDGTYGEKHPDERSTTGNKIYLN